MLDLNKELVIVSTNDNGQKLSNVLMYNMNDYFEYTTGSYTFSKEFKDIQYKVKPLKHNEIKDLNINDKVVILWNEKHEEQFEKGFGELLYLWNIVGGFRKFKFIKEDIEWVFCGYDTYVIKEDYIFGLLIPYTQEIEDDHRGQVYNPFTKTWSWGFC